MTSELAVRELGVVEYAATLEAMRSFTEERTAATPDEIWLLQHPSVFTLGTNADSAHVLDAGDIPVVKVDRGGQVTWHGPGQLVCYVLLDLTRRRLGVRELVCLLEKAMIDTLAGYGIAATGRDNAPGVYVDDKKVGSIGLRVRRHCSYHGLALNVNNDTNAFQRINPCGYEGLDVTTIAKLGGPIDIDAVATDLRTNLITRLDD